MEASLLVSGTQWSLQVHRSDTRPCHPPLARGRGSSSPQTKCGSEIPISLPCLGLCPPRAQPALVCKHPPILHLWEVDLLGPEVFRNRYQPCSLVASSAWAGGLSPLAPQLCLFSQCVCISVSALPTGGNAFKKISVINVVSFVVSHCKGSEGGFIFLTCLA